MSLWGNIVFREGRQGNDGNSVHKREIEVRYFESGRILFWIHDTVQRGGTWICILLFKYSFTSAVYSEENPPILRTLLFPRPQCFF